MIVRRIPEISELRAEVREVLAVAEFRSEISECARQGLPWAPRTYRELGRRRLLAPDWPREYGGLGGSVVHAAAVAEELALAGVPDTARVNTVENAGTALLIAGDERQKSRHLPRMAAGEVFCSVLYTEPSVGSDLSSLRTTAEQTDQGWSLNGTKIWNVRTDLADHAICAARTGSGAADGAGRYTSITLFLLPLDLPGVTVRTIESLNPEMFTEVTFEQVVLPRDAVVGDVGGGWPLITSALGAERTGICFYGRGRRWLDELIARLRASGVRDSSVWDRIAALHNDLETARALSDRTVGLLAAHRCTDTDLAAAKWLASELAQQVALLSWEVDESRSEITAALCEAPGLTLAAGTSEIMLGTVGAALLDRDPADPPDTMDWRAVIRDKFAEACAEAASSTSPAKALRDRGAEQGWWLPTRPANEGGIGAGETETVMLAERIGRAGLPPDVLAGDATLGGTLGHAGYLLGAARRAIELAANRAGERIQFGTRIADFQGLIQPLAADSVRLDAASARLAELCRAVEGGTHVAAEAADLYADTARRAVRACLRAIQVHGAFGLTEQTGTADCYRNVLAAGRRLRPLDGCGAIPSGPARPHASRPSRRELVARRMRLEWNHTEAEFPDRCVHELFQDIVRTHPDAVALTDGHTTLTYAELNNRANRLAGLLREHDVGPGELVGICLERSADMIVAVLGVLKSGGAYVPLDPEYPADRLSYMLADTGARIVCTQDWMREWLPEGPVLLAMDDLDLNETGQADPPRHATARDLAYVIYTSGSSGRPKGVEIEHRGVVNRMTWDQRTFHFGPDDVVLQQTSLSFDISVWEIFAPLLAGGKLVLAKPGGQRDPAYLMRLIADEQVTAVGLVPSLLDVLLDEQPGLGGCPALRYVFSGGEELTPALCARFFERAGAQLYNFYGPSEATVDVTCWHCTSTDVTHGVPIGRPLSNVRVYLLDADGLPVPAGLPGELHVAGAGVARGYHNRPELTAERFVPDPFSGTGHMYRTGDLARHRPDGALEFLGRLDEQVKVRGFRVEPGEVEEALRGHPDVRQAAVCAVHRPGTPTRLEAFVVGDGDAEPNADELRAWLGERLPAHLVPNGIHPRSVLPLTPNGKVDRSALVADQQLGTAVDDTGLSPAERSLKDLTARVLGVPDLDPDADFFQLGGSSLQAARLVNRVRHELGLDLTLGAFLQRPNVRELAALLIDDEEERSRP